MEYTEEELDYNKIVKGLYGIKTLSDLKVKYANKGYMQKAINQKLKEAGNEHN